MNELLYALVIVAAIALLGVRQSRPRRIGGDGRSALVLPAVLVIIGISQGHLIDPHHHALSLGLLAAELVVGLFMGLGWSATSRLWTERDGTVFSRGTRGTALVWLGGIAARGALMGIGAVAGVHQGTGPLLITLGISIALRGLLLMRRAASLSHGSGASYRDGVAQMSWKDRG